ncbi:MAG: polysaccharide biosynthesis protein PslG [Solirubrobacteraceae bacterium]|jgi:hypothetical protein|nr:polysaccharide biosynthesis protein PslG [Solirubrobacteraceae bacterium]
MRRALTGSLLGLMVLLIAAPAAHAQSTLLDALLGALAGLFATPPVAPPPPPVAPPPVAPPPVAPPPVAPPPPGSVSPTYHGINGQFLWDPSIVGVGAATETFRTAQLQAIRGEGLTLLRHGAPWSLIEPVAPVGTAHAYQWGYADTVASTLARKGVRWYPILGAPPVWASGAPPPPLGCPLAFAAPTPGAVAAFAAFAGAFAARYGPNGAFWRANATLPTLPVQQIELFNEPNVGCSFNTGADDAPARYGEVYAVARTAIRAAVPATLVVSGGLASGAANASTRLVEAKAFVVRMIAARPTLAAQLDALGLHPYAPDADQTFAQIAAMRSAVNAATPGRVVPIEVTEAGWFTQGSIPGDFWGIVPPITEAQRATMLKRLATELPASDCTVTRFIPHTWISPELDPLSFADWFGIVSRTGVEKPSAIAYGAGIAAARGATVTQPLVRCP